MKHSTIDQVRDGMKAMSADGYLLGIVRRLIADDTYTFVEVVSEVAVMKLRFPHRRLFLPMTAVAEVMPNHVLLRMDARAAKAYTAQPAVLAREERRRGLFGFGAGGSSGWGAVYDAGVWSGGGWSGSDGGCGWGGDGGFGGDGGCGGF